METGVLTPVPSAALKMSGRLLLSLPSLTADSCCYPLAGSPRSEPPHGKITPKSTLCLQASPAACYICRLQDVPGRFLPDRARELGVRPGPLFGQLKGGEAVMGSARMVQPEEVRGDSQVCSNGTARCLRHGGLCFLPPEEVRGALVNVTAVASPGIASMRSSA